MFAEDAYILHFYTIIMYTTLVIGYKITNYSY